MIPDLMFHWQYWPAPAEMVGVPDGHYVVQVIIETRPV